MNWLSVENFISNLNSINEQNKPLSIGQMLDIKQKQREELNKMQEMYEKAAEKLISSYVGKDIKSSEIANLVERPSLEKFYFDKLNKVLINEGYELIKSSFGIFRLTEYTPDNKQIKAEKLVPTVKSTVPAKDKLSKSKSVASDHKNVVETKPDQVKETEAKVVEINVPTPLFDQTEIIQKETEPDNKAGLAAFELLKSRLVSPELIIDFNEFLKSKEIGLKVVIKEIDIVEQVNDFNRFENYRCLHFDPVKKEVSPTQSPINSTGYTPQHIQVKNDASLENTDNTKLTHLSAKKCPECGNIVFSKSAEGLESKCFNCGTTFKTRTQIQTYYKCHCCGKTLRLTTDMDIETINCVECKAPIDLEYNAHKGIKQNI